MMWFSLQMNVTKMTSYTEKWINMFLCRWDPAVSASRLTQSSIIANIIIKVLYSDQVPLWVFEVQEENLGLKQTEILNNQLQSLYYISVLESDLSLALSAGPELWTFSSGWSIRGTKIPTFTTACAFWTSRFSLWFWVWSVSLQCTCLYCQSNALLPHRTFLEHKNLQVLLLPLTWWRNLIWQGT